MSFLNLFKKQNDNPVKYTCLGVKAREDEFSQDDLNSCFDFVKKAFYGKAFTKDELKKISEQLGFNIEDYYVFIEEHLQKANRQVGFKVKYLWQCLNDEQPLSEEIRTEIENTLSKKGFLSRAEIENLSNDFGCSVWDRNKWGSYSIANYDLSNGVSYSCVNDPRDSEDLKRKIGKS